MNNSGIITAIITAHPTMVSVSYEAEKTGDRLAFGAPGLLVYVRKAHRGVSIAGRWPVIRNQALQIAQAHHIPMISFVDYTVRAQRRRQPTEAQKRTKKLL